MRTNDTFSSNVETTEGLEEHEIILEQPLPGRKTAEVVITPSVYRN